MTSDVAATLAGVSDSIHAVSASTTMPHTASMPDGPAQPDRQLTGHRIDPGNALLDELSSGDSEEDHRPDGDRFQEQHPTVAAGEDLSPIEAVHLDEAGEDRDGQRRRRDPGEAAHGMDEILLAGTGQHHPGQQDQPAEPHRHGQRVGDPGGVAEKRQLSAGCD